MHLLKGFMLHDHIWYMHYNRGVPRYKMAREKKFDQIEQKGPLLLDVEREPGMYHLQKRPIYGDNGGYTLKLAYGRTNTNDVRNFQIWYWLYDV